MSQVEDCYFNWLPQDCWCDFLVLLWEDEAGLGKDGKGSEGWLDVTSATARLTCRFSTALVPALRPYPRGGREQTSLVFGYFQALGSQRESGLKEQTEEQVKKLSCSSSSQPRCQNEITKNFLLGCNWSWLERCHISKAQDSQQLIKCCLCL